jgi:hypothetical protein
MDFGHPLWRNGEMATGNVARLSLKPYEPPGLKKNSAVSDLGFAKEAARQTSPNNA